MSAHTNAGRLLAGLAGTFLLAGCAASASPTPVPATPSPVVTPSPATPISLGSMTTGRVGHAATLLEDGRVLITGGDVLRDSYLPASAELYDPTTGAFTPTGRMTTHNRGSHSAIRLNDGRVLLIGGASSFDAHWPETWDPTTGDFTQAGGWDALGDHAVAAGPLADGRVLGVINHSTTAELYDPVSDTVSRTGSLHDSPWDATATLLADGRVLIAGGASTVLQVYDPKTGDFTVTDSTSMGRTGHAAVLLADGRVLIVGGLGTGLDAGAFAPAEIYDPTTGTVHLTGSMITPRAKLVATLLADGRVLVTGGGNAVWVYDRGETLASAELYDPATGTFSPTGSMGIARTGHTATLLRDGTVLIAGGTAPELDPVEGSVRLDSTASAELYDPATGTFSPIGGR